MKRVFEILLLAAACSIAQADDLHVVQSEIDMAVSTNAITTNGVSTAGFFQRIVARVPPEITSAAVSFVDDADGSTLIATNIASALVASGFGIPGKAFPSSIAFTPKQAASTAARHTAPHPAPLTCTMGQARTNGGLQTA